MYREFSIPEPRRNSPEMQRYAATEWKADGAFVDREFAVMTQRKNEKAKVAKIDKKQARSEKGWAFRLAKIFPMRR